MCCIIKETFVIDFVFPQVETHWDECENLPDKLKDWDAYNEMKNSIKFYLDVFPILHKLASKVITLLEN